MSVHKLHNAEPADAGPTPEQLLAVGSATAIATDWLLHNAGRPGRYRRPYAMRRGWPIWY